MRGVGIDEGDEVLLEVSNGIILKPIKRKVNKEEIKEFFKMRT